MSNKYHVKLIVNLILGFMSISAIGQDISNAKQDTAITRQDRITLKHDTTSIQPDTAQVMVSIHGVKNQIKQDTSHQEQEISPLDISKNRGVYILANNGKLQLRILGSIRFSALYDFKLLPDKSRFSTYDIPTGNANYKVPNYYCSLNLSRFGFEVTRKIKEGNNIFIRLEMDFAGTDDEFRIRHAYGQFSTWLLGQTWSLLSNVNAQSISVNRNGPTGSISIRTPQIRYSFKTSGKLKIAAALEYSLPDFVADDSLSYTSVQTMPNLSARISRKGDLGYLQLSGILAPITGVDSLGSKSSTFGFGVSVSGYWNINNKDKLFFQGTYGEAISHFINAFRHSHQDLSYNPNTQNYEPLGLINGNITYEHSWNNKITSNASFGWVEMFNKNYQEGAQYNYSYSISANAFWNVVDGAKVGMEYMFGERFNIDGSRGKASRIWVLFYYDF